MAHAITNVNGMNEIAYVGETPWHGLGQQLTAGASLETWQAQAGMAWSVRRSKVRYAVEAIKDDNGEPVPTVWNEWADKHVLFRSDTKAPLGVVSDGYKVVQPREVLEFFAHVAEENGIRLETAGTLNGGRQYWALAKTRMDASIGGVDKLGAYVLLATSCDGSMATQAQFTSIRVVCANTLALAHRNSASAIRVKHSTTFDATKVRIDLGLADATWQEFTQNAARMAMRPLTRREAVMILVDSMGDRAQFDADSKQYGASEAIALQPNYRGMASIMELFNGKGMGSQLATANGTAWGLVNAATQHFDYDAGRKADTRLQSAWFGINAGRKQAIVDSALALCD